MKGLRALEAAVIRIEGIVAVTLVLTMLALAGYNVFYRNVLVRMHSRCVLGDVFGSTACNCGAIAA